MADGQTISQWLLTSALVVLAAALGSATAYCTQGSEWIEYNGGCYRWSRTGANWFSAELDCGRHGGSLVSIRSQGDNNFLQRLTQCSNTFWIGMVNTVHSLKAQTKGYEWWDRTPHNYTMLTARGVDYLDCVQSDAAGKWHNAYCQNGLGYVCKAPAVRSDGEDEHSGQFFGAESPEVDPAWWWGTTGQSTDSMETETTTPETATPETTEETGTDGSWTDYPESTVSIDEATRADGTRTPSTTAAPTQTARFTTSDRLRSTTQLPNKCPSGWQLLDRSCYFVSDNRTNYFNAQMSCQALGGSVTSVLTLREHTLLTVALGCHSPVWIGLEKARPCFKQPNKDHCWVWMDRSPVNFFEWAPNQPLERREAECVVLDGQWNATNCYLEYRYVCKKALLLV